MIQREGTVGERMLRDRLRALDRHITSGRSWEVGDFDRQPHSSCLTLPRLASQRACPTSVVTSRSFGLAMSWTPINALGLTGAPGSSSPAPGGSFAAKHLASLTS